MSHPASIVDEGIKKVDYLMTHESTEVDRLASQHAILTDSMGALLFAPIDLSNPGLKILDLATANGIWLQDLQSSTKASHAYIGTDIASEMFSKQLAPSISLVIQSNTEPWPKDWHESFDLVHERFGLATSGQIPVKDIVMKMIELVKPGGWIEFVEADMTGGPNSTGKVMAQFGQLAKVVFSTMGVRFDYPLLLQSWLQEAGLESVTERVFDIPVGAKSSKPEFSESSVHNFQNVVTMFAGAAKNIPGSFELKELDELPRKLVEELVQEGGIQRVHVVYGRKTL